MTAYTLLWTGLFLLLGLTLRYWFGARGAIDKGYPLKAYMFLWPLGSLALSGCYAALFRWDNVPRRAWK